MNMTIREHDPTLKDAVRVVGMGFGGSGNIVATRAHPYGTTNSIVLWNPDADTCTEFELSGVRFLPGRNTALMLKPDGSILAAGRDDGILDLWRSPSQIRPLSWRVHEAGIRAVAFSPIADTVATASDRGEVTLLDISSGRPVAQFPSTKCPLHCLAFSPDGKTLAACGLSHNVWLWNVQTRKEILLLDHPGGEREGLSCLSFSPDGRLLVTASFHDGDVRLWEIPSGKQRLVLRGHIGGLLFAHFLPDGRTLATASTGPVTKLWHVATGQELTTLSVNTPYFYVGPDANSIVTHWINADGLQLQGVPTLEEIDRSYATLSNPKNN